ncbi:hypothetical protein C8Q74DRAFT_1210021, partial [Fomes fomentarius]
FLVELFPFHARAKGIAVFQWWGRAAGFFNQFVNSIGINNVGWKYYISYCVFLLFEVAFIWFLFPETSNRSLEELAFLFEGDHVRAEQQKRIEEEVLDNKAPVPDGASDKENVEHKRDQGCRARVRLATSIAHARHAVRRVLLYNVHHNVPVQ